MASGHTALIALGANVGNASENLLSAIRHIQEPGSGMHVCQLSRFLTTAPVGGPSGQNPYVNAVARVSTSLAPADILVRLKDIESRAGRMAGPVWGARPLDLDLIAFESEVLHSATLTIPHPRMTVRPFVLEPLAEVAPEWVHPQLGWTVPSVSKHLERSAPVVGLGRLTNAFLDRLGPCRPECPWRFVANSEEAMFDVRLLDDFDPGETWVRPRFHPTSNEIDSIVDQVLATCASLKPWPMPGSN